MTVETGALRRVDPQRRDLAATPLFSLATLVLRTSVSNYLIRTRFWVGLHVPATNKSTARSDASRFFFRACAISCRELPTPRPAVHRGVIAKLANGQTAVFGLGRSSRRNRWEGASRLRWLNWRFRPELTGQGAPMAQFATASILSDASANCCVNRCNLTARSNEQALRDAANANRCRRVAKTGGVAGACRSGPAL